MAHTINTLFCALGIVFDADDVGVCSCACTDVAPFRNAVDGVKCRPVGLRSR